jgi:hypothetical protein
MSTRLFLLVVLALGGLYLFYFERMRKRREKDGKGEDKPLNTWLSGQEPEQKPGPDADPKPGPGQDRT